ncbi:DUF6538 domain-containing protein, partial [Roseinatronobacter ekhonensis]|uniref:DUF6538 domain-containing protein n=1 Tax=Roseinatronobacter ekhonensis TaxID=254356 RepID=UPI003520FBDB
MAGAQRYLLNRNGRFFARLVVPRDLRSVVGKSELRTPLGSDRSTAIKRLPGAVAQLQHKIALGERKLSPANVTPDFARYPLAPDQIAISHYEQRLAFDDQIRDSPDYARVSSIGINDLYVEQLQAGVAGRLFDKQLAELIGAQIERFRAIGNVDATLGSDEWRTIARALCIAELEALACVVERDEGDFTGQPSAPLLVNAQSPKNEPDPVSLSKLWEGYIKARIAAGFMKDGGKRMRPIIASLQKFLGHNDAKRVAKKNIVDWRDQLLTELSAKTVSDMYLSAARSVFSWACENEYLTENPAAKITYTPSPAEAEFVDLTAGFGTIQLLLMIRPDFLSSPARLELEAC